MIETKDGNCIAWEFRPVSRTHLVVEYDNGVKARTIWTNPDGTISIIKHRGGR